MGEQAARKQGEWLLEKVINHDFGGEKRQAARHLRKFLDLDALHEANIRDNPLPYLERASERIFQLQAALFEARQVLSEPGTGTGRVRPSRSTRTFMSG